MEFIMMVIKYIRTDNKIYVYALGDFQLSMQAENKF